MRKSFAALMAFMIFTLSLACAMPVCPAMAKNTMSSEDSANPPCHGGKSSDQAQNGSPMLSSDCLGVDLFHADTGLDLIPNLTIDHIDFAWADLSVIYDIRPDNSSFIRGPPFSVPPYFNESSLYLTTQRLRI